MKETKIVTITCPHCGTEYLPAEIFVPESFLGKPSNIQKDPFGKIVSFEGDSMDTRETYVCDYCKNPFSVFCKIQFLGLTNRRQSFDNDFVQSIK